MTQSKILPAVIALVVLEGINTAINILPGIKEPTLQGRNKKFVRAGIVNLFLIAGFVVYLVLNK